jgi:hypothetical protein
MVLHRLALDEPAPALSQQNTAAGKLAHVAPGNSKHPGKLLHPDRRVRSYRHCAQPLAQWEMGRRFFYEIPRDPKRFRGPRLSSKSVEDPNGRNRHLVCGDDWSLEDPVAWPVELASRQQS